MNESANQIFNSNKDDIFAFFLFPFRQIIGSHLSCCGPVSAGKTTLCPCKKRWPGAPTLPQPSGMLWQKRDTKKYDSILIGGLLKLFALILARDNRKIKILLKSNPYTNNVYALR